VSTLSILIIVQMSYFNLCFSATTASQAR